MPADSATRIFRRLLDAVRSDNRDEAQNALREGYELVNAEGVAAWLELFDPEIEWSEGDEVPERHVYRGHQGVLRQQERFREAWETFRIDPVGYAASPSGDRIAVIVDLRGRGRGSGAEVEARVAHLWEIRNGKAVRFHIYADPEKAIEAARAD
jgi:ketosteroid isomerase-like protein